MPKSKGSIQFMVFRDRFLKIQTTFPSPDPTYLKFLKTQTCQIYPRLIKKNQRIQEYRIGGRSDPENRNLVFFALDPNQHKKLFFPSKKSENETKQSFTTRCQSQKNTSCTTSRQRGVVFRIRYKFFLLLYPDPYTYL